MPSLVRPRNLSEQERQRRVLVVRPTTTGDFAGARPLLEESAPAAAFVAIVWGYFFGDDLGVITVDPTDD